MIDKEEEEILVGGGNLTGSMVGCRRIAATWAVGEAWARFSAEKAEVVRRAFRVVGLALLIDGSADAELSIKGIETDFLVQGLVNCQQKEGGTLVDHENGLGESDEAAENELVNGEEDEVEDDVNVFFD